MSDILRISFPSSHITIGLLGPERPCIPEARPKEIYEKDKQGETASNCKVNPPVW